MDELRTLSRRTCASRAAAIGACLILLQAPLAAHAGSRHAAPSFALAASATLHPGPATQTGGRFSLAATLSATPSAATPPSGGGYALTARLDAQPLTCESDLIFENGFDP